MGKMIWEDDTMEPDRFDEGAAMDDTTILKWYIAHKIKEDGIGRRAVEDYEGKIREVFRICRCDLQIKDFSWQMMRPALMRQVFEWMKSQHKTDKNGNPLRGERGKYLRKYSDYSCVRYGVVMKGFYKVLFGERLVGRNLLEGLKNPKVTAEVGIGGGMTATKEEVDAILSANWDYYQSKTTITGMRGAQGYRERSYHAMRNQAMILFLTATARRPIEMCRTLRSQVTRMPDGRGLLALEKSQTKNKHESTVYIDRTTMDAIDAYQVIRDKVRYKSGDHGWLFAMESESCTGNQAICSGRWAVSFRRIVDHGKRMGIIAQDRKLTPYALKRYAYHALHEVSVQAALDQSGHRSGVQVAAHYVRDKSRADLARQMAAQSDASRRMALDAAALTDGLSNVRLSAKGFK